MQVIEDNENSNDGVPSRIEWSPGTVPQNMGRILKKYAVEDQENWDKWLPYAKFTYNTTPHTATGLTPHELVYGDRAEIPTVLAREPRITGTYDDYVQGKRKD